MEALGLPSLPTPTLAFSSSHHLKARKLCSTASPWLRSCCPFPPKVKALHRTHHLPVRKLYTMCFAVLLFFFFFFWRWDLCNLGLILLFSFFFPNGYLFIFWFKRSAVKMVANDTEEIELKQMREMSAARKRWDALVCSLYSRKLASFWLFFFYKIWNFECGKCDMLIRTISSFPYC